MKKVEVGYRNGILTSQMEKSLVDFLTIFEGFDWLKLIGRLKYERAGDASPRTLIRSPVAEWKPVGITYLPHARQLCTWDDATIPPLN